MLFLALVPMVEAHIPHDVVAAVAAPRDLSPSQPWFVIANPWSISLLYRSTDGGVTWDALGGDPTEDILVAAAILEDHAVVVASETRLWMSMDGGDTWTARDAPATVVAIAAGSTLTVVTKDGLWVGEPDSLARVAEGSFASVAPDGSAAVDDRGTVWLAEGSRWIAHPGPGRALSVVRDGEESYVGATDGLVWRSEGEGWAACGALPAPTSGSANVMVGHLAIDPVEGTLLVTSGWRAPFRSPDQCATWVDTGWTAGDPLYDVWGGAQSQVEAFTTLYAYAGNRLVAGWAGLARSADGGATWTDAHLVAPDSCRAALIPENWPANPTILLGPYGAGPLASDDGGATWSTDAHGLTEVAPQQFVGFLGPDDDWVLSAQLHDLWVSADRGRQWTQEPGAYDFVSSLGWFGEQGLLLESGLDPWGASTGSIAASWDFMQSWSDVPDLNASVGPSEVVGYTDVDGGRLLCVAYRAPSGVACSDDDGASWTARYVGAASSATPVVACSATDAARLVWLDTDALRISEDEGWNWQSFPVPGGGPPMRLVATDDETLLLANRAGRVFRSLDCGDSWTDLGLRTPAYPNLLVAVPGFGEHGAALILTHDGPYVLRGGQSESPTLDRFSGYSRVDDSSGFMDCEGCLDAAHRRDAGLDSVVQVPAGAVASVGIRGAIIAVLGEPISGGEARVLVDGIERGTIQSRGGSGIQEMARVSGLASGWHTVSVEGTQGSGIYLDAIEGYSDGVPLPGALSARCGCANTTRGGGESKAGRVTAASLVALILLVRRRREGLQRPRSNRTISPHRSVIT